MTERRTDGAVFDRLHEWFGVGDYNPDRDGAWYKWRAAEIGKLRRIRTARGVALDDIFLAAEFSRAKGLVVTSVFTLFERIPDALRWQQGKNEEAAGADLERAIAVAISLEREKDPASEWASRLTRAAGAARAEVYREWESSRFGRA